MPKIVNERERELVLEAVYQSALALIQEKGLRGVTVDDITQSVGMAKGSFYKYYPSKEECLYEVLKRSEREGFARTESALTQSRPSKELLVRLLHDIYLAEDSLVLYVTPKEIEALMRKLPAEFSEREEKKAEDYFERTLRALGARQGRVNIGVLAHLMDSLSFIAAGKDGRAGSAESKMAMGLIVDAIAEYLMKALEKGETAE